MVTKSRKVRRRRRTKIRPPRIFENKDKKGFYLKINGKKIRLLTDLDRRSLRGAVLKNLQVRKPTTETKAITKLDDPSIIRGFVLKREQDVRKELENQLIDIKNNPKKQNDDKVIKRINQLSTDLARIQGNLQNLPLLGPANQAMLQGPPPINPQIPPINPRTPPQSTPLKSKKAPKQYSVPDAMQDVKETKKMLEEILKSKSNLNFESPQQQNQYEAQVKKLKKKNEDLEQKIQQNQEISKKERLDIKNKTRLASLEAYLRAKKAPWATTQFKKVGVGSIPGFIKLVESLDPEQLNNIFLKEDGSERTGMNPVIKDIFDLFEEPEDRRKKITPNTSYSDYLLNQMDEGLEDGSFDQTPIPMDSLETPVSSRSPITQDDFDRLKSTVEESKKFSDVLDKGLFDLQNSVKKNLEKQGQGKSTGLYNHEIEDIMKKYTPSFKGVISYDEIKKLLPKINKNENKISFIMSTTPSSQSDGHWVAIFIDKKDGSLEYFDSYGEDPPKSFNKDIQMIIDKIEPEVYLKYKINRIKRQSMNSTLCGFLSIQFLMDRYKGIPFKECTHCSEILKSEKQANKLKKKFESFGYI